MSVYTRRMVLSYLLLLVGGLLLTVNSWGADTTTNTTKPRVACLGITDTRHDGPGTIIQSAVSSALINSGRFTVCEREKLDTILHELKTQGTTGLFDAKTIKEIGRFNGVQYLVFGEVEAVGKETEATFGGIRTRYETYLNYSVSLKVAEVTTGDILLQFRQDLHRSKDGSDPDFTDVFQEDANNIAQEFTKQFITKVPLVGNVIAVQQQGGG